MVQLAWCPNFGGRGENPPSLYHGAPSWRKKNPPEVPKNFRGISLDYRAPAIFFAPDPWGLIQMLEPSPAPSHLRHSAQVWPIRSEAHSIPGPAGSVEKARHPCASVSMTCAPVSHEAMRSAEYPSEPLRRH